MYIIYVDVLLISTYYNVGTIMQNLNKIHNNIVLLLKMFAQIHNTYRLL